MYKKKVRCINSESSFDLTIGKIYDVESISSNLYHIIDDMGEYRKFYNTRFETVNEVSNNESSVELFPIY